MKTAWCILMLPVLMSITSELPQAEPWWGTLAPEESLSLLVPFAWLLFYTQPSLGCCLGTSACPGPFLSSPSCWWGSFGNLWQSLADGCWSQSSSAAEHKVFAGEEGKQKLQTSNKTPTRRDCLLLPVNVLKPLLSVTC